MKKNKMMRLASAMLMMTLLTTSVISGTFAKYVTTASGSDTARVAKWGVTVTANGSTFADAYAKDDTTFTLDANSVISAADRGDIANGDSGKDKVLAPGTKGSMVSMTLAGAPEVAVRVSYEATVFELGNNWVWHNTTDNKDEYYCPIVITVKEGANDTEPTVLYGMNYASADNFEVAVKDAIKAYSKDYEANTDLSTVTDDSLNISWEWSFENKGVENLNNKNDDIKDTYLGDRAASDIDLAPIIELEVTTTVTQID